MRRFTTLSRRERAMRWIVRNTLRALLPETAFLRLYCRFAKWRAGVRRVGR